MRLMGKELPEVPRMLLGTLHMQQALRGQQ